MKPVAIIRHAPTEGPGHFAIFLERHRIPWQLIAVDRGEHLPHAAGGFSGIASMGGPMSVNDDLPWIADECELIRDAVSRQVPVLGHCLGGQMIAKALGGGVGASPVREIGWLQVSVEDHPLAEHWLGTRSGDLVVFQWHGETFSIPTGATRILRGTDCANQAFVIGPHLAMQCHVEMTRELIASWCEEWAESWDPARPPPPNIQSPREILAGIDRRLPALHRLAEVLYTRWIAGLVR